MDRLKRIKLFLLDMDGTIYLDNSLFDGTTDFLNYVKSIGGRYIFLTNNSSKSVDKYIEKLDKMGIAADKNDFLTSTDATVEYLRKCNFKKIYALGTESFKEQLAMSGLSITDEVSEGIDCLCMGYDTELTYKKLEDACMLLNEDIAYIATNPDWVCPTRYGYAPDCGSVSEMLARATGKKPKFIGKPEPAMAELAMKMTGFQKCETAVMGDRLYTDIACGVNAGISTIFVLSGEGTKADIEEYNIYPDYIFSNIRELCDKLERSTKIMRQTKKTWITSAHQGFVDENLHSNTLAAYELAAKKGADMIETDARMTKDGVLIVHHDEDVKGYDELGNKVRYVISETDYSVIRSISLLKERVEENRIPTLKETLHLAYFRGMCINIDLKEGIKNAEEVAKLVVRMGMRGRCVYATNGAGAEAINSILSIDPQARFIDTKQNYTKEALKTVKDYQAKCYVYTGDFSDENIEEIRSSGCMLAAISLNEENAKEAFRHHPDMAEYPHTSDFEKIETEVNDFFSI